MKTIFTLLSAILFVTQTNAQTAPDSLKIAAGCTCYGTTAKVSCLNFEIKAYPEKMLDMLSKDFGQPEQAADQDGVLIWKNGNKKEWSKNPVIINFQMSGGKTTIHVNGAGTSKGSDVIVEKYDISISVIDSEKTDLLDKTKPSSKLIMDYFRNALKTNSSGTKK